MKLALSGLIVLGAVGALPLILDRHTDDTLTATGVEKTGAQQYRVRILGREGSCSLVKRGPAEALHAEIELTGECFSLMPRLADARYWKEKKAGDVAFTAADGRKIVEFFPSDGVAYESSYPKSPLIALTAQ